MAVWGTDGVQGRREDGRSGNGFWLVIGGGPFNAGRMIHPSKVLSIHPYFKIKPGKLAEVRPLLDRFVAKTSTEPGNLYYDFTLNGDNLFCREAYEGAEGLLRHLENVAAELAEMLKVVDVVRVEVHGSAADLAKLKGPLAGLKPEWFEFQCGVVK